MMDNLSVMIGTSDNYSHLWKNFDILFQRYWELDTKNYMVGETKSFNNNHYIFHTQGKVPWGECMRKTLDVIDTEYTFFILEDYYFTTLLSNDYINSIIQIMIDFEADKYLFDNNDKYYTLIHIKDSLYRFANNSQYLTSTQPSIWKTDLLRELMLKHYSPWDFERKGSISLSKMNKIILFEKRNSVYFNMTLKGKLLTGWEKVLEKENLEK